MFVSNDEYARKYDKDLLREIHNDEGEKKLIAITYNNNEEITGLADKLFVVNKDKEEAVDDAFISLNYILYAQIFALLYSLELGISPDNPRPDGTVNRVVKGVIIHDYIR
jgi:tagatose-6-phosphate ketose/aldose isomerase